jgi:hypothetical protein
LNPPSIKSPEPIPLFFTVTFRAAGGRDAIKGLRRLLKYALRQCGLRATDIRQARHD